MVEDEARGVVVLFGGRTSNWVNDTWEWDGTNWNFRSVAAPSAFMEPHMTYDYARRRVVLSALNAAYSSETWEWDGTAWTRRNTAGISPHNGTLAFDPVRNRVVQYSYPYTLEYGPTHPASFRSFGTACAGTAGMPQLAANGLPWLGNTVTLSLTSLPTNTVALLCLGYSNTSWPPLALPFSLAAAGMPGCTLYASGQLIVPAIVNGTTASLPLAIPQGPELLGAPFYAQSLVLDPPANAPGLTVSNAGAGRIGGR
jgi:hypothetical protein